MESVTTNLLNEVFKTITLNQLIIREATYNRKWRIEMGHSEMACPNIDALLCKE